MEIIEHFCHEHPLAFRDEDKNEEQKAYSCSICDLPMLSSPSYTCTSKDCKFFVHKPCAQLPHELKHPLGRFNPSFSLKTKPRYSDSHSEICHKLCRNFTYTSESFKVDLHPLCARPVKIKSKHESHNEHPLAAMYKQIFCVCNACGVEHKGFFFVCRKCNFWIHRDCVLLPGIVKHVSHPHPFILIYALFETYRDNNCRICGKELLGKGIYSCGQCPYVAHVNCATSDMENLTSETGQELIHLPDEGTTFPSLIIRTIENKRIPKDIMDDKNKLTIEEHHNHPLIFHNGTKHENQSSSSITEACLVQESVCNACIQPINILSPFWGCAQPDCHFLLHNFCMENIPYNIKGGYITEPLVLRPDTSHYFFHSVFPCYLCRRPCNGFAYYYDSDPSSSILVDLECTSAAKTITHASHRQHVLFIAGDKPMEPFPCCSDGHRRVRVYSCASCDFKIHIGCALLQKKVRHKFDKHPLELVFTDWVEKDCYFCEFCEQDIDQRHWFYHCAKCDQSFHVKCIPSVGVLSKVKFGGPLNVSCHPDHLVALTRMLVVGNQRCGYCEKIIEGFVDEMAFYCSECEFWIHFGCARDCSSDDTSRQSTIWYDATNTSLIF